MARPHDYDPFQVTPDAPDAPDTQRRISCLVGSPPRRGEDRAAPQDRAAPPAVGRPTDGVPADLGVVVGLTARLAEINQSLDALEAGVAAVRAAVASIEAAAAAPPALEVPQPRPAPGVSADDVVAQAARLSSIWIERPNQDPLRAALVMLESWSIRLHETVRSGRLQIVTVIDEALDENACPFGRWLHSGKAVALDPVRTAEVERLHAEQHRLAAQVLTEVRDGRVDQAQRLLESEDGYDGTHRRLDSAVRSWIDVLSEHGTPSETSV